MQELKNLKLYLRISYVLLFFVFLAFALFGVGDLDWDRAKRKVNKYFAA